MTEIEEIHDRISALEATVRELKADISRLESMDGLNGKKADPEPDLLKEISGLSDVQREIVAMTFTPRSETALYASLFTRFKEVGFALFDLEKRKIVRRGNRIVSLTPYGKEVRRKMWDLDKEKEAS